MAEATLNQVPVLGGAGTIYQRRADGPWYVHFWVKAERKRFRRSLETSDKSLAIRTAEQIVLDALTKQKAGQKVISSTLGDVIDKWLVLQGDGIKRGEIRSEEYVRNLASVRHFFATERLAAGAPHLLVAKSLGHSLTDLTSTYEHILMEQEGVIRDVWRDNTPKELMSLGVVVTDPDELLSA